MMHHQPLNKLVPNFYIVNRFEIKTVSVIQTTFFSFYCNKLQQNLNIRATGH